MNRPYNTFQKGQKKGQPRTLTDRVIRYLVGGLGFREVNPGRTSKYRKFSISDGKRESTGPDYWVGPAGAVRSGRTPSSSISLTDKIHRQMTAWEATLPPSTPTQGQEQVNPDDFI